jgi:hypothetical protein
MRIEAAFLNEDNRSSINLDYDDVAICNLEKDLYLNQDVRSSIAKCDSQDRAKPMKHSQPLGERLCTSSPYVNPAHT